LSTGAAVALGETAVVARCALAALSVAGTTRFAPEEQAAHRATTASALRREIAIPGELRDRRLDNIMTSSSVNDRRSRRLVE
jgi:hypothetical protein